MSRQPWSTQRLVCLLLNLLHLLLVLPFCAFLAIVYMLSDPRPGESTNTTDSMETLIFAGFVLAGVALLVSIGAVIVGSTRTAAWMIVLMALCECGVLLALDDLDNLVVILAVIAAFTVPAALWCALSKPPVLQAREPEDFEAWAASQRLNDQ